MAFEGRPKATKSAGRERHRQCNPTARRAICPRQRQRQWQLTAPRFNAGRYSREWPMVRTTTIWTFLNRARMDSSWTRISNSRLASGKPHNYRVEPTFSWQINIPRCQASGSGDERRNRYGRSTRIAIASQAHLPGTGRPIAYWRLSIQRIGSGRNNTSSSPQLPV